MMIKSKWVTYYCPSCRDYINVPTSRATKTRVDYSGHGKRVVMRLAKVQRDVGGRPIVAQA